jgi:hypothetical protein
MSAEPTVPSPVLSIQFLYRVVLLKQAISWQEHITGIKNKRIIFPSVIVVAGMESSLVIRHTLTHFFMYSRIYV